MGSSAQYPLFCSCTEVDGNDAGWSRSDRTSAGAAAPAGDLQRVGLGWIDTRERQPDLGFAPG